MYSTYTLCTISDNDYIAKDELIIMCAYIIFHCNCIHGKKELFDVSQFDYIYGWMTFTDWYTSCHFFHSFLLLLISLFLSYSLIHSSIKLQSHFIRNFLILLLLRNNSNPYEILYLKYFYQLLLFVRGAVSRRDCGIHFFPLFGLSWLFALGGWCCLFLFL